MSGCSIYILGAGRVGAALALLFSREPGLLAGLWTRRPETARAAEAATGLPCASGGLPAEASGAGTVIIAVADPAVEGVAREALDSGLLRQARVVLHCGGARPAAEALAPLAGRAALGTFHPLLAVASPRQGARLLPGGMLGLEGDPQAMAEGRRLAGILGAGSFQIPAQGMGLYHAAAVMASNHAVSLWHTAARLLGRAGIPPADARQVLLPLLRSVLQNVEDLGVAGALTGPVRRGDAGTVARHLDLLRRVDPDAAGLYHAGTLAAVRLMLEGETGAGPDPDLHRAMEEILRAMEG